MEQIKKRKLQGKDEGKGKKKSNSRKFGPEPEPQPEPVMQPEPEPIILIGPEPQEVIDGFVAACKQVEETEAAIKACEEVEMQESCKNDRKKLPLFFISLHFNNPDQTNLHFCSKTSFIYRDQPAPTLMMVASVATQAQDYDPSKAFDLGIGTPRQSETPEIYDLDDFPKEPENPVTQQSQPQQWCKKGQ
ncbi:hypothetical protein PIB30_032630 [Stylosanthes scabra]|uniref:Uncharacterized protein n=1 Tax=Stylosanthes scabra TaxID=79078 RepID=A0ABU6VB04_9FABA|nr:hypothetical protein [Stylosanthes scabra]